MLLKRINRQFFFGKFADQNTKGFFLKKKRNVHLEGENNERLYQMPKWTRMYCMTCNGLLPFIIIFKSFNY